MKYSKILVTVILLGTVFSTQAQKPSKSSKPDVSLQARCCPDTNSLISDGTDIANADVAIQSPVLFKNSSTGSYTFKLNVANLGDDCSYCTKVIVLLPPEIKVTSYAAYSPDGKRFDITRCFGTLLIDIGMMCPTARYAGDPTTYIQSVRIEVVTSGHTKKIPEAGFAIMAYSKMPDMNQANNYWSGKK